MQTNTLSFFLEQLMVAVEEDARRPKINPGTALLMSQKQERINKLHELICSRDGITYAEICEETGWTRRRICNYIRELKEAKKITLAKRGLLVVWKARKEEY